MVDKTTWYILITQATKSQGGKISRKLPLYDTETFGVFQNDCEKPPYVLFESTELTAKYIGDRSPYSVAILRDKFH